MEIETIRLKELYQKAILAFNICISNPDNKHLEDEVLFKIKDIILIEDFVQLKFLKHEIKSFTVEVKLQLASPAGNLIGKYFYYENEAGVAVDDVLIFD